MCTIIDTYCKLKSVTRDIYRNRKTAFLQGIYCKKYVLALSLIDSMSWNRKSLHMKTVFLQGETINHTIIFVHAPPQHNWNCTTFKSSVKCIGYTIFKRTTIMLTCNLTLRKVTEYLHFHIKMGGKLNTKNRDLHCFKNSG